MIHGYINKKDLVGLVNSNRKAVIVPDITTKDIDEYINSCWATLSGYGFDMNKLTQPKTFKEDGKYNVVLSIRQNAKELAPTDVTALEVWKASMGNVFDVAEYLRKLAGVQNSSNKDKIDKNMISCLYKTRDNKRRTGKIKLETLVGDIKAAYIMFDNKVEEKVDVSDCNNQISEVIAKCAGYSFREYKLNLVEIAVKMNGKMYKYKVEPTPSSMKLTLI